MDELDRSDYVTAIVERGLTCFVCTQGPAAWYSTNVNRLHRVRLCDRCRDRWSAAYGLEVKAIETPPEASRRGYVPSSPEAGETGGVSTALADALGKAAAG